MTERLEGTFMALEREVAADLRRTIEAYGAGNLRQGLKIEELIERVRNEMHAERG
jgi:hypothetical protein